MSYRIRVAKRRVEDAGSCNACMRYAGVVYEMRMGSLFVRFCSRCLSDALLQARRQGFRAERPASEGETS